MSSSRRSRVPAVETATQLLEVDEYRLAHFVRWCNQKGRENLKEFSSRTLHDLRLVRCEEGDLNKVGEKTQMHPFALRAVAGVYR